MTGSRCRFERPQLLELRWKLCAFGEFEDFSSLLGMCFDVGGELRVVGLEVGDLTRFGIAHTQDVILIDFASDVRRIPIRIETHRGTSEGQRSLCAGLR